MNSFFLKSRQLIGAGRGNYGFQLEHEISKSSGLTESHHGNEYSFNNSRSSCGEYTTAAHPPRARILVDFRSDYQHPVQVTESKDYNEVRGSRRRSAGFDWTRDWTRTNQPYAPLASRCASPALCGSKDCDREKFPIYDASCKSFGVAGLGKDLSRGVHESGTEDQLSTDDDGSMSSPLGQSDQATTCTDGIDDHHMRLEKTLQGHSGVPSASSSSLNRSTTVVYPWMRKLHSTSGNCHIYRHA